MVEPAPPVVEPAPHVVEPAPPVVEPAPHVVAPAPTAVELVRHLVEPVSDVSASVQDMPTPVAGAVVPLTQLQSLIQDLLTPVVGAVVPLTQLQSDLYSFLLDPDLIALVQDLLTPAVGAVVPTPLQSEFYSFLLGIAGMEPAAGLGGLAGAGRSPAADAWVGPQWRRVLSLAAIGGGTVASKATGDGTLGEIAASIFGATTPPLAPNGAISTGTPSFFRHADQLLLPGSVSVLAPVALPGAAGLSILAAAGVLPISLAALAALALPGVGGLVILTGAGVRVGYRQAKAGFAVRTAGIARFACPGPFR